jgi:hypothetical protein
MSWAVKQGTPKNFYSLDGHTDADTTAFIREFWDFEKMSSEDDYEGFDSTQGPEFQIFDALLMRAMGIPEAEIQFYLEYLPSIETFLGPMGPMMASGFKFTLLLNTERSKAYQATKYDIAPDTPMATTGDDVACNAVPPFSGIWGVMQYHLRLISKRTTSKYPVFCGWIFNPVGCFKMPGLLLHRTAFQLARGNLPKCILNYMADITPLNVNLERFSEYLTPEQLNDHFATLDILRSEAKACGIKVFGQFEERYGAKRLYDLTTQHGGNPNTSITATMPYSAGNWERAEGLMLPNFIPISQLPDLRRALLSVDYSVIESRREGQTALNNWLDHAVTVCDDVDERIEWVIGKSWNNVGEEHTLSLVNSLHSVLEHRTSNVAKDVDQGRRTGRQTDETDSTRVVAEQGSQDNIKRFEVLRKDLLQWLIGRGRHNARSLERIYGVEWVEKKGDDKKGSGKKADED